MVVEVPGLARVAELIERLLDRPLAAWGGPERGPDGRFLPAGGRKAPPTPGSVPGTPGGLSSAPTTPGRPRRKRCGRCKACQQGLPARAARAPCADWAEEEPAAKVEEPAAKMEEGAESRACWLWKWRREATGQAAQPAAGRRRPQKTQRCRCWRRKVGGGRRRRRRRMGGRRRGRGRTAAPRLTALAEEALLAAGETATGATAAIAAVARPWLHPERGHGARHHGHNTSTQQDTTHSTTAQQDNSKTTQHSLDLRQQQQTPW